MEDFIKRAKEFYSELDKLEDKYDVMITCGYNCPGDDENVLMAEDMRSSKFVKLNRLAEDDVEEEEE